MIDKLESVRQQHSCERCIRCLMRGAYRKMKTLRTVTEDGVPNVQLIMWVQFIFGTCSASESMRSIILLLICLVLLNLP